MKILLPALLVFIRLNAIAQFTEGDKVRPIFASQQYTLTIKSTWGMQTYEFEKHKTTYGVAWYMGHNKHMHKVIWDNYQNLESLLKENAYMYFSFSTGTKHPIPNYVSYTINSKNQSIAFEGEYINVPKTLRHIGWMQNAHPFSGGTGIRKHG